MALVQAYSISFKSYGVLKLSGKVMEGQNSPSLTIGPMAQKSRHFLRLDNTGAWVMEVYPSLLCGLMSENDDLYIKLKLGIFSFI